MGGRGAGDGVKVGSLLMAQRRKNEDRRRIENVKIGKALIVDKRRKKRGKRG